MRAIGIILAGGKNEKLHELTNHRALAAMPIAGSYRTIDFALSNMTNSDIKKVAVITQYNSRSLMKHLSSSKWWDFGRKQGGLFVFTPYRTHDKSLWYRGTADAIYQNIDFLKNSHEPYAIISSGNIICKMDFNKILAYHVGKKADITVVCKDQSRCDDDIRKYGVVQLDENNRIMEFEEKPLEPNGKIISTGVYIIRRRLLIELLEEIAHDERYDLVHDLISRYRKKKKIYAYLHESYFSCINSLEAYHDSNMNFLTKNNRNYFFRQDPYVVSKVQDEPPAKYNYGAIVHDSLVSAGCIINGKVEKSILFPKVFIGENSVIQNTILLDGAYVGNNCSIKNCIVDTGAIIKDNSLVKGEKGKIKIVVKRKTKDM